VIFGPRRYFRFSRMDRYFVFVETFVYSSLICIIGAVPHEARHSTSLK